MPQKTRVLPPNPPKLIVENFFESSGKNTNFFSKRKNGEFLAPQGYYFTNYQLKSDSKPYPGTSYIICDGDRSANQANDLIRGSAPLGIPSNLWPLAGNNQLESMHAKLANSLSDKIRNADINLPVTLIEAPKTMELVGNAARDIAVSFRALTRGMPTEALNVLMYGSRQGYRDKNIVGAIADRYLEWHYGVMPTISDVEGAALALAKHQFDQESNMVHVTTSNRDQCQGYAKSPKNPGPMEYQVSGNVSISITGRGDAWGETLDRNSRTLDNCGFANFALAAWELVPYSFVVDWFLPIGSWLNGFTPVNGLRFLGACTYVKAKGFVTRTSGYSVALSRSSTRTEFKERRPLGGFPSFTMPAPDFSNALSHMKEGLALLVQGLDLGKRQR